ncbi:MAG: Peptidyl-tRNA hydrolase [Parcubacteria group bacterium GW2011_GWA1_47_11]|uniref:Peptidyl-tRNA hydrolase n=1 Tax=Candidatus Nomurabacteria bacterium GW2011_GWB1_47_6 TaxID=1618749 RepID=A0A0G1VXL9_9BACT|nr:MAG: Peptidyl-tRNA hydrolase [Parcubacteria group bacterium GW2011_GWA1_47_11]KKU74835.1 MAG: Peptidyl-tRNA hydrolase [Candidatus Nomurabacteria bacterium GW2011_GWB1_47_6]
MKLVVGLGNPGTEYENTRHNTGRILVGLIEKKLDKENNKQKIKFLTPDTFMNNSGRAVVPLVKSKKDLKDLVVIYDDIDLPIGKMKISFNRSSGGHNGLQSIIKALKSEEFLRIRIGIAPRAPSGKIKKPKGEKAVINFILGEFKKPELETIKKLSKTVVLALETIFAESKEKAMSLYN